MLVPIFSFFVLVLAACAKELDANRPKVAEDEDSSPKETSQSEDDLEVPKPEAEAKVAAVVVEAHDRMEEEYDSVENQTSDPATETAAAEIKLEAPANKPALLEPGRSSPQPYVDLCTVYF